MLTVASAAHKFFQNTKVPRLEPCGTPKNKNCTFFFISCNWKQCKQWMSLIFFLKKSSFRCRIDTTVCETPLFTVFYWCHKRLNSWSCHSTPRTYSTTSSPQSFSSYSAYEIALKNIYVYIYHTTVLFTMFYFHLKPDATTANTEFLKPIIRLHGGNNSAYFKNKYHCLRNKYMWKLK